MLGGSKNVLGVVTEPEFCYPPLPAINTMDPAVEDKPDKKRAKEDFLDEFDVFTTAQIKDSKKKDRPHRMKN